MLSVLELPARHTTAACLLHTERVKALWFFVEFVNATRGGLVAAKVGVNHDVLLSLKRDSGGVLRHHKSLVQTYPTCLRIEKYLGTQTEIQLARPNHLVDRFATVVKA